MMRWRAPAASPPIGSPTRWHPRLRPWLAVLFVGSVALAVWFLIAPTRGPEAAQGYYRAQIFASTYRYRWAILPLFVPWAIALFAWHRGERVPIGTLAAGAVVLHLLVLFAPPPQSQDVWQYLFYGHMQAAHGANPYVVQPVAFYQDPWFSARIHWPTQTSDYGPVWTMLTAGIAAAAPGSILRAFALYKVVVLAVDLAAMWLLVRLGREGLEPGRAPRDAATGDRAAGWALLAFAWNPLVLVTVPLAGEVDIALVALILGAALAHRRGRPWVATVLLTIAALVKLYAGIGLVLFLVLRLRERGVRVALGHAVAAAALAVAAFLPYWAGTATFRALVTVASLQNTSLAGTAERLLEPVLSTAGMSNGAAAADDVVRVLAAAVLAVAVGWAVARTRDTVTLWAGTAIVLLTWALVTPWFVVWYLLVPLALVAVLPRRRVTIPLLTLSGTALFYVGFAPLVAGVASTVGRYGPPIVVYARRPGVRGASPPGS